MMLFLCPAALKCVSLAQSMSPVGLTQGDPINDFRVGVSVGFGTIIGAYITAWAAVELNQQPKVLASQSQQPQVLASRSWQPKVLASRSQQC
jgi:hypothetical protein